MTSQLRLIAVLLTVATILTTACASSSVDCDASAHASVSLTIVDAESGDPVASPSVQFRVDGGELQEPADMPSSNRFSLAWEVPGSFEVTVEADGYEPAAAEYEVTQGECHVDGVSDTIELVPL